MQPKTDPAYWELLKTKLKEKYPELSAEDFKHKEGDEERMLRMIEYKLRMSKEKMKEIIAAL